MPGKNIRSPLKFHKASAPEPSGTSQGTCTKTLKYLHRNFPKPRKVSAPEPSGTAQNPLEPYQVSLPEPSRTVRNLTRYLHQNPPEPCPEPGVEAAPDRTGANLG